MAFDMKRLIKIFATILLVVSFTFVVLIDNIKRYTKKDVIAMESEERDPVPPTIMICPVRSFS